MSNRILVLGSTGKTGTRVIERLQQLEIPFTAGSRNGISSFNWDDAANWQKILTSIDTVYITFQPDLAVPGSIEKISLFVDNAKQAKVKKLVLLSGRGEREAEACEQIVARSGLHWVIIRSSWFMQNFSESFLLDSILENKVVLPVIKASEPFIDLDDLAEIIVKVLLEEIHNGHTYEITGPELLSFERATELIATATDRVITYAEIDPQEYDNLLRSFQLSEDYIWLIRYLFSEVLDGRNESVRSDAYQLLNRKPYTFKQYVDKTIKTGIWNI